MTSRGRDRDDHLHSHQEERRRQASQQFVSSALASRRNQGGDLATDTEACRRRQAGIDRLRACRGSLPCTARYLCKTVLEPSLAKPEAPKVEVQREEKPAALGEQGKYDASVAAAIVNGKFALHIPYYRLQDIFAASGWTPSRSSIDYVSDLAAEAIVELPKLMIRRLLAGVHRHG